MAEEVTGIQFVVSVNTAALEKLRTDIRQTCQEGVQQLGQTIPQASEKAGASFRAFGSGTRQLRVVLAGLGVEGGEVASKFVKLSYALETGLTKAGFISIGITALAGTIAFLATKMSSVSDSTQFNKFMEGAKERVAELRKEAERLLDTLDARGPGEKGLSKTRQDIGRIRGELEAIELKRAKENKEVALPGTEDSTNKYRDKQKHVLEAQLAELLIAERDFQEISFKEMVAAQNKRFLALAAAGNRELAEHKRVLDEEKRLRANMNEFRNWQKDQESSKLSMEYDAWWAATQKWAAGIDAKTKYEKDKEAYIDKVIRASVKSRQDWQEKTGNRLMESEEENMRKRREETMKWIDVAQAGGQATLQIAGIFDLFGEKSAKSEEERAKAVGQRLGFENVIMAATEIARAASSSPNVPEMVMHGIAAALHTAAAVKCFSDPASVGGFSGAGGGSAASAGAQRGAQLAKDAEDRSKSMAEKGGGVVINIYGNQINGQGADKMFSEGAARWAKKQKPNAPTGRL